jgi:tetratricopeptide (TPR) repeat protein
MKSSPLGLSVLLAVILLGAGGGSPAVARDTVLLKNGQTREGQIVGVSGNNVQLRINEATAGIPLGDIQEIRMDAPPEFEAAATQLAAGDTANALVALQRINDTFAGLPAPWAQRAAALLGDAKLAGGDSNGARAAYEQFRQTYPEATALADLGSARLAVEEGQYDEARTLVSGLLAASPTTALAATGEGAALSQAHYLQGRLLESDGNYQGALENYLKASVVFSGDPNAATAAQARADALRADHPGLIAP